MMVEEEDRLDDEDYPKKMASVAHYIMTHFAEKESIKINKRRSTSPRQANTA
jgi:hypothetical protein